MSIVRDIYNLLLRVLLIEYNTLRLRPVNGIAPGNESNDNFCRRKKREREDEDELDHSLQTIEDDILSIMFLRRKKQKRDNKDKSPGIIRRGKYKKRSFQFFTDPDTGVRRIMSPKHTVWYQCYIENPKPECDRWQKLFRYRFRMPYQSFLDLVGECEASPLMSQWSPLPEYRYNKRKGVSLELLVLSALRWLGRGWTMDDLHEST